MQISDIPCYDVTLSHVVVVVVVVVGGGGGVVVDVRTHIYMYTHTYMNLQRLSGYESRRDVQRFSLMCEISISVLKICVTRLYFLLSFILN